MALLECKCFSDTLGKCIAFNIIYPESVKKVIGLESAQTNELPAVLYLLHGFSDDHTIWSRRTSIERYVSNKNLVVVMPDGDHSYYHNMAHGRNYFDFVSNELPNIVQKMFRVSNKRDDTFIAGLSMGGYGAFKVALTYPEKYSYAASLSGVVDLEHHVNHTWDKSRRKVAENILGANLNIKDTESDLYHLVTNTSQKDSPKLFFCCGTEDFLYEGTQNFKKYLEEKKIPFSYQEGPGCHNWDYWDILIQEVLNWLPIK